MPVMIRGLGTAVPQHSISQDDAAELAVGFCCSTAQQTKLLPALYRRTGVRTRHSVILDASTNGAPAQQSFYANAAHEDDHGPTTSSRMDRYEVEAGRLAGAASKRALEDAAIDAASVTHLITVSCSGFHAPGFDISLITDLPLHPDVERTHIGFMGCHGALNGLRVARAFIEADPKAVVLLCAVELCSLHQQYGWNPEQIVANALFADGAAAVVLTSQSDHPDATVTDHEHQPEARARDNRPPDRQNPQTSVPGGDRSGDDPSLALRVEIPAVATLRANASHVVPDSTDFMTWRIRDNGFEMTLSPKLPHLVRTHLSEWVMNWLSRFGLTPDEIKAWAVHPGGPRVLSATGNALGLDDGLLQPSRGVLADYGNMSSPTVLFILERLREQASSGPCVMLGYGPGITIEAALLEV